MLPEVSKTFTLLNRGFSVTTRNTNISSSRSSPPPTLAHSEIHLSRCWNHSAYLRADEQLFFCCRHKVASLRLFPFPTKWTRQYLIVGAAGCVRSYVCGGQTAKDAEKGKFSDGGKTRWLTTFLSIFSPVFFSSSKWNLSEGWLFLACLYDIFPIKEANIPRIAARLDISRWARESINVIEMSFFSEGVLCVTSAVQFGNFN